MRQKLRTKAKTRRIRDPLVEIPLRGNGRRWELATDNAIIRYARKKVRRIHRCGRENLRSMDGGLYDALSKRNLLGKVGFEKKVREQRPWREMTDREIVSYAKQFREIGSRRELSLADPGLYNILLERNLLDKAGFKSKRELRAWRKMSDDQLVAFTKRFMRENEISMKSEIKKLDRGLYEILRVRNLLEKVSRTA